MPRNYQQLAPSVQFENQLASSLYSVGFILPGSRSTVGFITRDFHALISRHHSQTNRRGLYTLFLASKSPCMQKISSVDALLSTQNVLSRSGRFGGGHTGWSQLQLASSVSPLWLLLSKLTSHFKSKREFNLPISSLNVSNPKPFNGVELFA